MSLRWLIALAALTLARGVAADPEPRCHARGPLPDLACTPGAVEIHDTATLCGETTRERRHVTEATKRAVLVSYGVPWAARDGYEVDHLISLELGGSNDAANLWPEAAEPRPGFHEKDQVENYLHREVCAGRMPLADAQHVIATDWLSIYPRIAKDGGR